MSNAPVQKKSAKPENKYRGTLNLPKTSFPMKANLVQNEPNSVKRWKKMKLYERLRELGKDRPRFTFHDGPPYANGSIHLGHVLNKTLKDLVVRSRTMMGFDTPFVPGWDCHGLPIEHRVVSDLVESGKIEKIKSLDDDARKSAIRSECKRYAQKQVKLQAGELERLMTLADYDAPYLTMAPPFEGAVLDALATLVEQGLVFRALKPVHWSIANETALAEAELEYQDREDLSVYVDFEAVDAAAVYAAFGIDEAARTDRDLGQTPSFMIWTTTPWTLPANLAIAVNTRFEYSLVQVDGNVTVLASELLEKVTKAAKAEQVEVLATAKGSALAGLHYRHPFVEAAPKPLGEPDADTSTCYTVVEAEYVTLEDGTGLVHTAPGHGADDFQTGDRVGLPVYCPVRHDGTYDETVPEWLRGLDIWDANEQITDRLRSSGHLFYSHRFMHSYPHDWRSKTPVIFRCTEQWFIGVDVPLERAGKSLRDLALDAVATGVGFVPEWGRNRMRGMVETRPDWCISRQRSWGLPIPAFFLPDGQTLMTAAVVRAVGTLIREQGSDAWFKGTPEELLVHYDMDDDPDIEDGLRTSLRGSGFAVLTKGPDILDVWFESGSTWNGCMRERIGDDGVPVELYLEGSDQHRGWFQSSLLISLGVTGKPPFRAVLTHGFMVGKDGKKLSKSAGHTVGDLFKLYGADVIRWWVCSLSYENDMKVDDEFFKLAGESYRKVRNTLRFMLSNLADFTPGTPGCDDGHCVSTADMPATSIDSWALAAYDALEKDVIGAYERYDFRAAHSLLYDFCNDTLSSVYLAAVKDRLYCDKIDAPRRRRTQTVLWDITDGLSRLLAPILPHTADETWRALHRVDPKDIERSVHTETFLSAGRDRAFDATADERWAKIMQLRDAGLLALEKGKSELGVENPLDAGLTLPNPDGLLDGFDVLDLADLHGVSRVELDATAAAPVLIDLRNEPRCDRSWKRDGTVKARADGGMLSDRDADAVGQTA
ncbi:MAG: isoleucine--tRNA ligase [Planctomycetota bacterium]|nr:isoleucine--tRNA ligase [Planctomycetota bacterium]